LNAISQLERGISRDPHYSTLVGLADALGMSVGELLDSPKAPAPTSPTLANGEVTEEGRRADPEQPPPRTVNVPPLELRGELKPAIATAIAKILESVAAGEIPAKEGTEKVLKLVA
jgi:transcriptional regulator with XRE-family HTH domain